MSGKGGRKALAVGGIIGVAVAAGVAAVVYSRSKGCHDRRCEEEDEDVFSAPLPQAVKAEAPGKPAPAVAEKCASAVEPKTQTAIPKGPVTATSAGGAPAVVASSEAAVDEANRLLEEALSEAVSAPVVVAGDEERKHFAHLGVSIAMPSGWVVREELSPMPNVAMVTVSKPEFAEMLAEGGMGMVPVIILSVEDISPENLDLLEFKDKSKQMALEQMLMMTGGMIKPQVKKDRSEKLGVFSHQLEYVQSVPPYFDVTVRNLLQVHSGLAYVFQIMCSPSVLEKYGSTFEDIAQSIQLDSPKDNTIGYLKVATGRVEVQALTSWSWKYPGTRNALAVFTTASTLKREQISLYFTEDAPKIDASETETVTVDEVVIVSATTGSKRRRSYTWGDFTLIVEPQQKISSFLAHEVLIKVLKSAVRSTAPSAPKSGAVFCNPDHGYNFNAVAGSRIISTRVGNGTVVYAPKGIPTDPSKPISEEEQGPTVTIRVGSPEDDPECMSSLDEWEERMRKDTAEADISDIKRTTINGRDCLTFLSKETQEVGPGQQLQLQGKVIIFVVNGKTTLLRWEAPASVWRKSERDLDAFVKSFVFVS